MKKKLLKCPFCGAIRNNNIYDSINEDEKEEFCKNIKDSILRNAVIDAMFTIFINDNITINKT